MRSGTFFLLALLAVVSCKVKKEQPAAVQITTVEEVKEQPEDRTEGPEYRPARTRLHDLLHTRLELTFDYTREEMHGKATLTLRPYFYPSNVLQLDAKGFVINEVALLNKNGSRDSLVYTYNKRVLTITLNKTYNNNESYTIYIDYTAQPRLSDEKGSDAITDTRGLYFINPDGSDPYKPRQIWTQGETEFASRWFPTIDSPNEKMTQEIYITADSNEVTLSNGELMYSVYNKNGTRTDCWKQDLPHSPYLAMVAVGKFAVVKDKWRDSVEVNYYVEPEYKPYAKLIFGNTPEMIEFFSTKLGVNYAWKKFSQVVVRDFVSGAMENTTAVVHGGFLQRDAREHLDETYEDVISHELFHHWFGDLVTCESWANLPLNESFATYGEYLWREYKYGKDDAAFHLYDDYRAYLPEGMMQPKRLIRYYYKDKDGMFDAHSYQKGGLVLHMLRNYVGDKAFFKSLGLYLNKRKFSTAEIHDLRMAFEEVTGEDLNWFFNQWFMDKGHPDVEFFYTYLPESKELQVTIQQVQTADIREVFRLPVDIDIYVNGKVERHRVWTEERKTVQRFAVAEKPQLVLFDPDKALLMLRKEFKENSEWMYQYDHVSDYNNRMQAFRRITDEWTGDSLEWVVLKKAMKEPFWALRKEALDLLATNGAAQIAPFKQQLVNIATTDANAAVRHTAFRCLRKLKSPDLYKVFLAGTNDSSYHVVSGCLMGVNDFSPDTALLIAELNKNVHGSELRATAAELLGRNGKGDYQKYFEEAWAKSDWSVFYGYGAYITRIDESAREKGIQFLEKARAAKPLADAGRYALMNMGRQLEYFYDKQLDAAKEQADKLKKTDAERLIYEERMKKADEMKKRVSVLFAD